MAVFINIDYQGWFAEMRTATGGRGFSRRAKRVLLADANKAAVEYWHRKIIPLHFERAARSRYHYQQRKKPYRDIKQALAAGRRVFVRGQQLPLERVIKGGTVDVVRKGDTEARAEQQQAIFATENKAVMKIRVPSYATNRRSRTGRPNMGAEILTITAQEKKTLVAVWKRQFMRGVRAIGTAGLRKRVRIS